MLFKYLLDRTRTRCASVPSDFNSATARCETAQASKVITQGGLRCFSASRNKRFAAATSRFSLSTKSTVRPCLSTARYRLGPPAFDLYIRLLASPGPACWSFVSAPTLLGHCHISLNPAQNRCVYQTHAPLSHYFPQVAQTQLVRDIPADAQDNHHSVKLTALEQYPISGLHFHSRYYRRPSNFAPESHFRPGRHRLRAPAYRQQMAHRFQTWRAVTGLAA